MHGPCDDPATALPHAPQPLAIIDLENVLKIPEFTIGLAVIAQGGAARLAPSRPASILADGRGAPTRAAGAIAEAIRNVLEEAVEAGGSTLRDHRQANGELGYFQHVFKVYDREGLPCARENCRGIVARITQSGRSTFYCSKCQH